MLDKPSAAQPTPAEVTIPKEVPNGLESTGTGEGPSLHGPGATSPRPTTGEETDVLIPGEDRSIPVRYEVRELADIRPSHVGETFSANPAYTLKNERDYSKPENQQRVVRNSSEDEFNPRYHITDNPDATNGPVVITEDGDVLGGNSRGMILQRVYGRNGKGAQSYRSLLERKAGQFGIDPEAVRGMKQPVLVRVVPNDALAALPGGSKWAIRKTNVTGTAQLSASERAAADAGQMSPDMMGHIATAIENAGPDATLNDALTGKTGTEIANRLISEGFFSEQERPSLMDGKTGALTQSAKDRISKALLGQFFRDADQIERTPANVKNKLERIVAPLVKVRQNEAFDIRDDIRDAIDAMEYKRAQGFSTYEDAYGQGGLFSDRVNPVTPRSAYFATLLEDFTPNEITALARKYATNTVPEEGMFGSYNPTPKSAMVDAVRDVIGEQERVALKKIDTKQKGLKEGAPAWEALEQEREKTAGSFRDKQAAYESKADLAFAAERPASGTGDDCR